MDKREERTIYHMLGRIEGTLESIEALLKVANDNHDLLEGRVRKVEQKQYFMSGIAAVIGTFIGYFIQKPTL